MFVFVILQYTREYTSEFLQTAVYIYIGYNCPDYNYEEWCIRICKVVFK